MNEYELLLALKFTADVPPGTKIKLDIARLSWMRASNSLSLLNKFSFDITTEKPFIQCPNLQAFSSGKEHFINKKLVKQLIVTNIEKSLSIQC